MIRKSALIAAMSALALATILAFNTPASAHYGYWGGPHWGGGHWGGYGFGGGYGGYGHGHFWHGRWWGYGESPCWAMTPGGWVWICG